MAGFLRRKPAKCLVIGLDCASPTLLFEQFAADLPNVRALMAQGTWGVLRSSVPCITVPAWASMTTSRDAGTLGIYGFRNRASYDYSALTAADSRSVTLPRLWERVGQAGQRVLVVNVPQTYPVQPVNGRLISDFLTPSRESAFTYPALLKHELLKADPDYAFDVSDFRTTDKDTLLRRIYDLTERQYRAFEAQLQRGDWAFAMHVNIALDRLHHGFWRYFDPQHRLYTSDNPYQQVVRDYYRFVDSWIGRLLACVDDQTSVAVVSDHGAKRMDGAIAINEWLRQQGWLALHNPPKTGDILPFSAAQIDWERTRAWSTGGYYGRIFLNVRGREPHGVVAPDAYEQTLQELSALLATLTDDKGQPLSVRAMRPRELYAQVNGIAPDLLVYFGELHWRAVGGFGYPTHYTLENDTGPDDANHAEEGLFLWVDPHQRGRGRVADRQLMDITPTVLDRLRLPVPAELQGSVIG